MVDSIHLIVRIDSIHLMANSIKGRLSKHLMVNSIKGRPFTIHPLTCNENCPPSFSPITTPQAMQTDPPLQQSPPHKQCKQNSLFNNHHPTSNAHGPPLFFINPHFTKIANGTPPPLFTNHRLKIIGHVEKMKMQENHHLGPFLMDTIICIM